MYDLMVKLAPNAHLSMVLMGDFNAILDPTLDFSNLNRPASVELQSWTSTGLSELWCWKHSDLKSYSHLSTTFRSSARIDLAFGNASMLSCIQETDYLAGGTSDHNPLYVTLAFPAGARKGGWRLSPGWLQNPGAVHGRGRSGGCPERDNLIEEGGRR